MPVSHVAESQNAVTGGVKEMGATLSAMLKSTLMPTVIAGVPLLKMDGRARVNIFLTPRVSK
jgi:hypothetical protein